MKRKDGLTRRQLLGTAGTLITMPLLESLMSPKALAQEMAAAKRLLIYYTSCGMIMENWTPKTLGANWESTPILSSLMPLNKDITVISDLGNYVAQGIAAVHSAGTTAFATGVQPQLGPMAAISADQLLANKFGGKTPYRSLQLSQRLGNIAVEVPPFNNATFCDAISWADPKTPLIPQSDPQAIFDNFFAGQNPKETAADKAARLAKGKSVLDSAMAQLTTLKTKLGQEDIHKVDQYTTALRAIETELASSTSASAGTCPVFERPKGEFELSKPEYYAVMHKIMVLAFQCDMTRYISFMFAPGRSERKFDHAPLNIGRDMHDLSHDGSPESLALQTKIQTYELSLYANLLQSLKDLPDIGGASILDNTISVFGNELSSGAGHTLDHLPILVAGGGGAIKLGQHIKVTEKTDLGNLWFTVLNAMGLGIPQFGTEGKKNIPGLV